jgi:DNA polymerase-1
LREAELKARMLLQVHDELVFECPDVEVQTLTNLARECMQTALPLSVPVQVDFGASVNWKDAHP